MFMRFPFRDAVTSIEYIIWFSLGKIVQLFYSINTNLMLITDSSSVNPFFRDSWH